MRLRTLQISTAAAVLCCAAPISAKARTDREQVRALIWQKELANYAGRATKAGLQRYIANIGEDYLVWPPGLPAPLHPAQLKAQNSAAPKGDKEQLTIALTDFTVHDGTAIIFYSSHKTMTATGEQVDERYDTIHVWARYGAAWKLIGGMARRTK